MLGAAAATTAGAWWGRCGTGDRHRSDQLYLAQFLAVKHFLGSHWPVWLLPLGIEDLPAELRAFDSVFSMGVLYHRRSPLDHLLELRGCLRRGGELVLETLVIEVQWTPVLLPSGRYAKMRNVWFLPSPETLAGWMRRCGFGDVRIIDISVTTTEEQRATEWMRFESLADYLDPSDSTKTIEGYPLPGAQYSLRSAHEVDHPKNVVCVNQPKCREAADTFGVWIRRSSGSVCSSESVPNHQRP